MPLQASHLSKISTQPNSAFCIPARRSCIGMTPLCAELCYALKNRFIFPDIAAVHAENLRRLRELEDDRHMSVAKQELLDAIPINLSLFRIHGAGDFYSQWYVDLWCEVVRARPHTHFWTYTRSFQLEFRPMLRLCPNFTLWASTDGYNWIDAVRFVQDHKAYKVRHAWWPRDQTTPADAVVCPATNGGMNPNGACERCQLCVHRDTMNGRDISFETH